MGAVTRAATLYSVGSAWDPDHEAIIRFGSEAPRQWAHSADGIKAIGSFGSPPPRISVDGCPSQCRQPSKGKSSLNSDGSDCFGYRAIERNVTPTGTSPMVTKRQSAISSLRASATIIFVLRLAAGPSVRDRYH